MQNKCNAVARTKLLVQMQGASQMQNKYNTMIDLAFTVEHNFADPENILECKAGIDMLLIALQKRLDYLKQNRHEAGEAFGVLDTYETNWYNAPIVCKNTFVRVMNVDFETANAMQQITGGFDKATKSDGTEFDDEITFGNVFRMAIQVCPDEGYSAWTQAVLFDSEGHELAFTEPQPAFLGKYEIVHGDSLYVVHVISRDCGNDCMWMIQNEDCTEFWTNEYGWCGFDAGDRFTSDEKSLYNLPAIGGQWIKFDSAEYVARIAD